MSTETLGLFSGHYKGVVFGLAMVYYEYIFMFIL